MFALQGGDVSSGADFARAKRYKKLTARLNSATARSKMTWLRRHSLYVLLFLIAAHTGGFIATRLLLASQKSHVASVCTLLHYIYMLSFNQAYQCTHSKCNSGYRCCLLPLSCCDMSYLQLYLQGKHGLSIAQLYIFTSGQQPLFCFVGHSHGSN